MTPQYQKIMHDPLNGKYGDCQRAAIASILDLPIDSVPNFADKWKDTELFFKGIDDFLFPFGLTLFSIAMNGTATLNQVMETVAVNNPDVVYMVVGQSTRGINHVVCCQGTNVVHDPHPSGIGLSFPCSDGYWWVEVLAKCDTQIPNTNSTRKTSGFFDDLKNSTDAPYPGMIVAFEKYFGVSFTETSFRREASVWASAWKAAMQQEKT